MNCDCHELSCEEVWFEEPEYDKHNRKTGRYRKAVSHIVCTNCGKNICVDDSFDSPWYRK